MSSNMKFSSTSEGTPVYVDEQTLHALGEETVSGTQAGFVTIPDCQAVQCILETTAIGTLVGDTFDARVQTYIGGDWIDVCAFSQLLGNDADDAQIHIAKIVAVVAEAMFEDAELAAGSIRNLIGTRWRCRWTFGAAGAYTFSIKIQPI